MNACLPLNAEVRTYRGKPAIYLNGEPQVPLIYALTDCPGGRFSWDDVPSQSIRQFAEIGFRLYQVDLWFDDLWPSENRFSIELAQKQIMGITAHCPDAAVFFRLHCNPPFWWLSQNPSEWVRYCDAETTDQPPRPAFERWLEHDLKTYCRNSFASGRWLEVMGRMVERFCIEFSRCPEASHLAGIQIANGLYGENHYWGFISHNPDVSEPMQDFFRSWLTDKYHTDDALRQAWNNPDVTLKTACVPGLERNETKAGLFYDPHSQRNISDYYECQHKAVTNSLLFFCGIVKKNWPRRIITGAFYGYYISLFGRQAAGGHLLEEEILNSDLVDYLSAPQAYNNNCRSMGGPGLSRGLIESVLSHGKLWLDEHDQPTHFGTGLGGMITYELADSIQNNRKCVLEPFLRGGGLWYYDFGRWFSSGWWSLPEYMKDIETLTTLMNDRFHQQFDSPADVLMVMDTRVFFQTGNSTAVDPITDALLVNQMVPQAFKTGASVATCYLSDLERMNLDHYRVIVFVNCFSLTEEQRKRIRGLSANHGRHLVWMTLPGYYDGHCLNPAAVSDTAGMTLCPVDSIGLPDITYASPFLPQMKTGGVEMLQKASAKLFGDQNAFSKQLPFFALEDPDAVVIGRYDDSQLPAAGYKTSHNHTDWFFSLPIIDAPFLREIFRRGGAHIYNEAEDSTLCGAGLLMIHSESGGPRTLTLRNGTKVNIELPPRSTHVWDDQTGEQLL